MLSTLRRIWTYEMTVAEWIGLAVILAVPYFVVGFAWAAMHLDHVSGSHGLHRVVTLAVYVIFWPLLLLTNMCMA